MKTRYKFAAAFFAAAFATEALHINAVRSDLYEGLEENSILHMSFEERQLQQDIHSCTAWRLSFTQAVNEILPNKDPEIGTEEAIFTLLYCTSKLG